MSASTAAAHELFLAHPSGDKASARDLYRRLHPEVRVFLDSESLRPGHRWDRAIPAAQRASRATVVLISERADEAWYLGDEIATAIALHRASPGAHAIIPVLLDPGARVPYGLGTLQAIDAVALGGMAAVADALRALALEMRGHPVDLPALPALATAAGRRDHKHLLERLRQAEARFEDLLIHVDLDGKLPETQGAAFGERVRYVVLLARSDPHLCEQLHELLDAHAPWTRTTDASAAPPVSGQGRQVPAGGASWTDTLAAHGCAIVPDEPLAAVDMATALLRIAAVDPRATRAHYLRTDHASALAQLTRSATATVARVAAHGSLEYLPPDTVAELVRALDTCRARGLRNGLGDGAPALKLAQVLDLHVGANFVHAFRGVTELTPDAPVPLVPFTLDGLADIEAEATDAPWASECDSVTWLDRVPHLRLAPETVRRLRVRLRWSDPWLSPVTVETRLAAVVTNGSLHAEFQWREYPRDGLHLFYEVRPRDAARQRYLLEASARIACESGATWVVMPELSWTPELERTLRDDGVLANLPLVVAGSSHASVEADEAPGHNLVRVYAHGALIHEQRKLTRHSYVRQGVAYREDLDRDEEAGFDVLVAPGCTAITLIFNDLGDPLVARLAEEMEPTVLLLPALTEDASAFSSDAAQVAKNHKGFSLIACMGSDRGAVLGRAGAPSSIVLAPTPTPCVVVFDLDGGHERADIQ